MWFLGSNLQWGISEYPKMLLKRDLIFGATDLLGLALLITSGFLLRFRRGFPEELLKFEIRKAIGWGKAISSQLGKEERILRRALNSSPIFSKFIFL